MMEGDSTFAPLGQIEEDKRGVRGDEGSHNNSEFPLQQQEQQEQRQPKKVRSL